MNSSEITRRRASKYCGARMWKRSFRIVVLLCVPLIVLVSLLSFRTPSEPESFRVFIKSKSGKPISKGSCLILFERRLELGWALPCPREISYLSKSIIDVVPYHGPVMAPPVYNYGVMYGPGFYSSLHIVVLAHGHKTAHFKLMRVSDDVTYHEKTSVSGKPWRDGYLGATYRITPATSEAEMLAEIAGTRDALRLHSSRKGRLPTREAATLVREFLEREEERLKMTTPDSRDEENQNGKV